MRTRRAGAVLPIVHKGADLLIPYEINIDGEVDIELVLVQVKNCDVNRGVKDYPASATTKLYSSEVFEKGNHTENAFVRIYMQVGARKADVAFEKEDSMTARSNQNVEPCPLRVFALGACRCINKYTGLKDALQSVAKAVVDPKKFTETSIEDNSSSKPVLPLQPSTNQCAHSLGSWPYVWGTNQTSNKRKLSVKSGTRGKKKLIEEAK